MNSRLLKIISGCSCAAVFFACLPAQAQPQTWKLGRTSTPSYVLGPVFA